MAYVIAKFFQISRVPRKMSYKLVIKNFQIETVRHSEVFHWQVTYKNARVSGYSSFDIKLWAENYNLNFVVVIVVLSVL